MFTILSVLLSTLFISMNAAQIFGREDAVLEPSSRPAGAGGEGDGDPARLPAQPKGSLHAGFHRRRADRERGARRRRADGGRGAGACGARGRAPMRLRIFSQVLYPLAGVLLIIAAWVLACWLLNIPTVVLPSPDKVLRALVVRSDLLLSEGWVTLRETLYGFVLAMLVGLPLAV